MSIDIFDRSSRDFTRQIDQAVAAGAYLRGRLFADAMAQGLAAGEPVLDYGCGPGRISALLARQGFRVEGCDPSPKMLAEAQSLPDEDGRLSFRLATDDGASLPDGRYGGIACSSVIEFVPEPLVLLKHFRRALKPGGLLALSFANRRSLWRTYARWRRPRADIATQFNVWTFAQAKAVLAATGFAVTSGPVYFEASPFDKRPLLKGLSASAWVGTLGFVTARRDAPGHAGP